MNYDPLVRSLCQCWNNSNGRLIEAIIMSNQTFDYAGLQLTIKNYVNKKIMKVINF